MEEKTLTPINEAVKDLKQDLIRLKNAMQFAKAETAHTDVSVFERGSILSIGNHITEIELELAAINDVLRSLKRGEE